MHFIRILKSCQYKRFLTSLYLDFPLLRVVFWLCIGQFLYLYLAIPLYLNLILFSLALIYVARVKKKLEIFLIFSGVLLVNLSLNNFKNYEKTIRSNKKYSVEKKKQKDIERGIIVKAISHPSIIKTREVSIDLKVVSFLNQNNKYMKLKDQKIRCKGVKLPWTNLRHIKKNDIFAIGASVIPLSLEKKFDFSLIKKGFVAKCNILAVSHKIDHKQNIIDNFRNNIIYMVKNTLGNEEYKAIFLSMTIGIADLFSTQVWNHFKNTGLAHLLVVSGFQVTLIYFAVFNIVFFFLNSSRKITYFLNTTLISCLIGTFFSILYSFIVGLDFAALRALIALLLLSLSTIIGRPQIFFNTILSTFFIMIVFWPLSFMEPGVQLTFSALIGIGFGLQHKRKVIQYLSICFWATLLSSIVSIIWFKEFYLISFVTNIILGPLGSILSCQLGFVAILLSFFDLEIFRIFLEFNIWLLGQYYEVVIWFGKFSNNQASHYMLSILIFIFLIKLVFTVFKYVLANSLYSPIQKFLPN